MKKITVYYSYSETMEIPDELITKDEEYNDFCPTNESDLIDYVIMHSERDYDTFTLYENETGEFHFLAEF